MGVQQAEHVQLFGARRLRSTTSHSMLQQRRSVLIIFLIALGLVGVCLDPMELVMGRGTSQSPVLLLSPDTGGKMLQQQDQDLRQLSDTLKPIAYVISLIKCGDLRNNINVGGMIDAANVLQYSVHRNSVRNRDPSSSSASSKYDYKMYAIVHKDAESCSGTLRDLGFELLIRDSPVQLNEMSSAVLRKIAPKAWCCGHAEFIKLYAYTLHQDHDIVVHVDIDFLFTKPMDDLYDAMLFDANSPQGQAARARIPRHRPNDPWPETTSSSSSSSIEAFFTRDWGQMIPGRKGNFQAGFVVLRPSMEVFEQALRTIRETDYVEGFSLDNGWGGKGYGGFVGSAAMQGFMAYFFDEVRPGTAIELDTCRFNHMGADVLYRRGGPNFLAKKHDAIDKCRSNMDHCDDCMITPLDQIYGIHYTECRKPWTCMGQSVQESGRKDAIPDTTNLEHCLELAQRWNEYREELENKLFQLTGDETIRNGQSGSYMPNIFKGHCKAFGVNDYLPISGKPETLRRIPELFAKKTELAV